MKGGLHICFKIQCINWLFNEVISLDCLGWAVLLHHSVGFGQGLAVLLHHSVGFGQGLGTS